MLRWQISKSPVLTVVVKSHPRSGSSVTHSTLIIVLTSAGPPEPPVNCSVVNQTTESLMVECLPGFDGGLDQLFHMEVADLQTGQLIANTSGGKAAPEFEVSGLNSGRGMKITIFAVNADGRSDSAVLEGFTLKVAELQLGRMQKNTLLSKVA